jgi:hypothetical protein
MDPFPDFPCLFGARPGNWSSLAREKGICLGDFAIHIAVAPIPPQEVAYNTPLLSPFYYQNGRWFAIDTDFGEFEVPVVATRRLFIVREVFSTRVYADCLEGGFAGLDFSHVLIISDGDSHSAVIDAAPFTPFKALEVLVTSFAFTSNLK